MKKKTLLATAFLMLFSCMSYANPTNYPTELLRVLDGDTMDVRMDLGFGLSIEERIRIIGYDAPETYRPSSITEKEHGIAAKEMAIDLLSDGFVVRKEYGRGSFGRVLVDLNLEDGRDYVDVMLEKGFYKRDSYE